MVLFAVGTLITVSAIVCWFEWQRQFPFGRTHCCAKGIGMELRIYAENHRGWLPHGRPTPEGSLSLLCTDSNLVGWICGKNIPVAVARAALAKDGTLGPASCGWHYVEGLRSDDYPQIAVAWDKIHGLGHNGQRVEGLARSVILLDGSEQGISEKKWPDFVADQKARLAKTIASRDTDSPAIRWSDEESLGPNTSRK